VTIFREVLHGASSTTSTNFAFIVIEPVKIECVFVCFLPETIKSKIVLLSLNFVEPNLVCVDFASTVDGSLTYSRSTVVNSII
jgi:hypothetical protein